MKACLYVGDMSLDRKDEKQKKKKTKKNKKKKKKKTVKTSLVQTFYGPMSYLASIMF